MKVSIETKRYPNVIVRTHRHNDSGIVITKCFSILENEEQVRDNLTIMCLIHDLQCIDCTKSFGEPTVLCALRIFNDIPAMIEYIKHKANKKNYSFIVKKSFALVTIGEKKYIYRIIPKKIA